MLYLSSKGTPKKVLTSSPVCDNPLQFLPLSVLNLTLGGLFQLVVGGEDSSAIAHGTRPSSMTLARAVADMTMRTLFFLGFIFEVEDLAINGGLPTMLWVNLRVQIEVSQNLEFSEGRFLVAHTY